MAQDSVAQKAGDGHLCSWCGLELRPESSIGDSVCTRCYQLLINAGIPEEEIFGGKSNK
jgi:hypothetical protein